MCFYFKMFNLAFYIVGMDGVGVTLCSIWFFALEFPLRLVERKEGQFHVSCSKFCKNSGTQQSQKNIFLGEEEVILPILVPQLIHQPSQHTQPLILWTVFLWDILNLILLSDLVKWKASSAPQNYNVSSALSVVSNALFVYVSVILLDKQFKCERSL